MRQRCRGIGYDTALIGKAHFNTSHTFAPTGTPECRESTARYGPDWTGPYLGIDHVELMIEGHNCFPPMAPPRGQHYERWYHAHGGEALTALYHHALPPLTDAAQTWNSALPVAFHNSTWIGDRTIDYLREHRDRPFCAWASFPDPHHPFDAPDPWCYMHHPDDVDLPEHRALDLDRRPWWHRAALEGKPQMANAALRKFREEASRTPVQTDEQLRHLIANYYGMISLIDHQVGRIRLALQDLGLDRNTIVVYSTDHGDWLGDHGLILKGPMAYEGLLRVGLHRRGAGRSGGEGRRRSGFDAGPAGDVLRLRGMRTPGRRAQHDAASVDRARRCRSRFRVQRMAAARVAMRRRSRAAHRAHGAPQADARAQLRCRASSTTSSTIRSRWTTASTIRQWRACGASLSDMIASRPEDEMKTPLPQVGMA